MVIILGIIKLDDIESVLDRVLRHEREQEVVGDRMRQYCMISFIICTLCQMLV